MRDTTRGGTEKGQRILVRVGCGSLEEATKFWLKQQRKKCTLRGKEEDSLTKSKSSRANRGCTVEQFYRRKSVAFANKNLGTTDIENCPLLFFIIM